MIGKYKTVFEYLDDSVKGILELPFESTRDEVSDFCKYFEDFAVTPEVFAKQKKKAIERVSIASTNIIDDIMLKTKYEDGYFVNSFFPDFKFVELGSVLYETLMKLEIDSHLIRNEYYFQLGDICIREKQVDNRGKYKKFIYKKDVAKNMCELIEISKIVKKNKPQIISVCNKIGINIYFFQKKDSDFLNIGTFVKIEDVDKIVDFFLSNKSLCKNCSSIFQKKNKKDIYCSKKCKDRSLLEKRLDQENRYRLSNIEQLSVDDLIIECGDIE